MMHEREIGLKMIKNTLSGGVVSWDMEVFANIRLLSYNKKS